MNERLVVVTRAREARRASGDARGKEIVVVVVVRVVVVARLWVISARRRIEERLGGPRKELSSARARDGADASSSWISCKTSRPRWYRRGTARARTRTRAVRSQEPARAAAAAAAAAGRRAQERAREED